MTSYKERLQNFYDTCNSQKEQSASGDGKLLISGGSCRIEYINGRRTLVMDTVGRKDVAYVCKTLKEQGLVTDRMAEVSTVDAAVGVVQDFATSM